MHLSDTTRKNLDRTYRTTAGASRVTRSTLNSVHNVIQHLVAKKDTKGTGVPAESTGQRLRQEAGSAYSTLMDVGAPALNKLKAKAGYGSSSGYTGSTATAGGGAGTSYAPPPLPPRGEKPPLPTSEKPPLPPRTGEEPPAYGAGAGGAYGYDQKNPSGAPGYGQASYLQEPSQPGSGATTPSGKKRPLLNRSLLAVDSVLSSLEAATNQLLTTGTSAASQMAGHRYGNEAGEAVAQVGGSARNAVLVYVDVRGMGRRAILKSTARGYVKARLRSGEKVELQGPNAGAAGQQGQQAQAVQAGMGMGAGSGQQIGGPDAGTGAGGQGLYGHGKQDIVVDVPQMKN